MEPEELLNSEKYLEARKKIDSWKRELRVGGETVALQVEKEKIEFFAGLRGRDPELCKLFHADEAYLGEEIYRKLMREEIIID
jgi:hypothetical protein